MACSNKNNMTSTFKNDAFNFDFDVHHPTMEALIKHNNSAQGFVALCQGLKTQSGDNLINVDDNPWKAMPIEHSKPKAKMFLEEVVRRHDILHLALPKPRSNNQTIVTCQQWLDKNPILNLDEIKYLSDKIAEHKAAQKEANASRKLEIEVLA